jgi:hypothetical protein
MAMASTRQPSAVRAAGERMGEAQNGEFADPLFAGDIERSVLASTTRRILPTRAAVCSSCARS